MLHIKQAAISPSPTNRAALLLNGVLDRPLTALSLYVVAFSVAMLIGHGGGALQNDTVEAYAWGKELQLGYAKHPPFWAWIAYGWFSLFPTADWAAYLLSALNAAIGLGCTYLIGQRFVSERQAMAGILCLMATPIYFCLASRFNANTVLLSLWPATTLFALRSQEADRISDGIATGLLAAACMLSKYHSALFIAVLFFALPLRSSLAVWRSRSAIACYVAFAAAILPSLIWLHSQHYIQITYVDATTWRPFWVSLREAITFPLTSLGFFAPALVIFAVAVQTQRQLWWRGLVSGWTADRIFVTALLFGPIVLTIAACVLRSATVKPIYIIAMIFMGPIWLAMIPGLAFDARTFARIRLGSATLLIFYLVAAPVVGFAGFIFAPSFATRPTAEVARLVTKEWHARHHAPLRFVAGDEAYALSVPFYSPDHPSYVLGFDMRPLYELGHSNPVSALVLSPWLRQQDLVQHGLVVICSQEELEKGTECPELVRSWRLGTADELKLTVARKLFGLRGPDYQFRIFFIARRPDAPPSV